MGNAYVTGQTHSFDFPAKNPLQAMHGEGGDQSEPSDVFLGLPWDIFVAKFPANGTPLLYSTYLGGQGTDGGTGIAVDSAGSAYITGYAYSNGLATGNAWQTALSDGRPDAFVAKLNSAGSSLVFFSYLGGNGEDLSSSIALDAAGNIYMAGGTVSPDFPTVNPIQAEFGGGPYDAYVAQLNADASKLIFSTYLGGQQDDYPNGLAVSAAGELYVAGITDSADFPTAHPLQPTHGGGETQFGFDVFISKINLTISLPKLTIARSGTSVLIFWPTNPEGFHLEATGNLLPPLDWTVVPELPIVIGGQNTVISNALELRRFYRLKRP